MKFNSPIRYALAVVASILIASCGGGGAKVDPNQGGTLQLLPTNTIFYAGVAYTMTIQGGKAPYALTSNNPSLLPVPLTLSSNQFQVVGANPFVVDPGLPANALPVKTVTLSVNDSSGQAATATIQVGRNFLTGYSLDFTSTTCTGAGGAAETTITPCAGGDTTAELDATISGNFVGDAQYTLDVVQGAWGFVNPIGSSTVTQSYTTTSDHQGKIIAIIRVPASTPTEIGVVRVTHVASGVSTNYAFLITGAVAGPLSVVPSTFTFTGADSSTCGGGSGDFFVSGGTPPYSAASSNPNVAVAAKDPIAGHFTITVATSAKPCITGASIVVSDSVGTTPVSVTVNTVAGATAAPVPLNVSPTTTGTLTCGTSTSVVVTGGSGAYQAASSGASTAVVASNVVTITAHNGPTPPNPAVTDTITITDGTSNVAVSVPPCT